MSERDAPRPSTRVLVVEDEALLALDYAQQLRDAGLEVVGLVASVANGLKIISEGGCDVAVLDVNLGNETSAPIASALRARGTPFIVVSGYSSVEHPDDLRGAPSLSKPIRQGDLVAALRQCIKNA